MASKYIFLLLPTLICARIEIEITASQNQDQVQISGSNVDVISNTEKFTFGLNDDELKRSVEAYFGKRPSDVFVSSPTPWGDLFTTYGWPQVTRILTPQRAKIQSITSSPTIVVTQVLHNNSSKTAEFSAQIHQDVQNTVSSTWEKSGNLTVGQEIRYGIDIEFASVSGKTSFSYTTRWGESTLKSETVTVGSQSGVSITLEPNQSVIAELYATRGSMNVEVEYEATLSGSVALNYDEAYRGHHFWALDVNGVLNAGGLRKSVKSKEVITLGYYSDSRVVIKDSKNKSVLYSAPLGLY